MGVLPATASAADPGDIGKEGALYAGASNPSGEKPQSKLWWNDGLWWASMFDGVSGDYHIFRLDVATQTWVDTKVLIDPRANTRQDTLWDGRKLYISSQVFGTNPASGYPSRLYRYSYNATTDTYTRDAGFPVNINNYRTESLVLDKDSNGKLWATWVQGGQVYVNRTVGDDKTWGTPFVLPASGASVATDDISSLVSFGGNKIGVMWTNQVDSAVYFAVHHDGEPDTTWGASRVAYGGVKNVDDHINLRSLQEDGSGRVYAAIKTSQTTKTAPLIVLLVLDPATGSWSNSVFGRVSDSHTRPILLLDTSGQRVYVFATGPHPGATSGQLGGDIYMKSAPLAEPVFEAGVGTPVIRDADSAFMNNASSTKQTVNSTTGLVVLATNNETKRYWHYYDPLGAPPPNAAPAADDLVASTTSDEPVTITLSGRDAETCELDFVIDSGPARGDLGAVNDAACTAGSPNSDRATVTYTPNAGSSGSDSFAYHVSDGSLRSPGAVVTVSISSGAGTETISFRAASSGANATETTLTITAPAGVVPGDVMLAAIDSRGAPVITPPSGWTLVRSDTNGTTMRKASYVAVAGASEPASYTWTLSSAKAAAGGITAWSGVDAANPVDASGGQVYASSSSIIAPSITTTVPNTMLLGFFGTATSTTVAPPSSFTERWDVASTAGTYKVTSESASALQAGTGATGTITATAANSAGNIAQLVALRPAGSIATPPENAAPPTISGTAEEGQTFTADPGTWSGTTPIAYAYQWQRCDISGGSCEAIAAATTRSYTLATADVGSTIRVAVTATNSAGSATTASSATSEVTARPVSDPVIAAAGDIACDPESASYNGGLGTATECRQLHTSDVLTSTSLTAVLALGDLQYETGAHDKFVQSYDPTWGRVKAMTYPVPGNHEYQTTGAAGYFQYFGARAGDPNKGYYSFDVGTWHVVALNSECARVGGCGAGSAQEQWLRADLAAHETSCTLAFWHRPRFSSGYHGNDAATEALWQALYDHDGDLIVTGHDHDYERFAPQTAVGTSDPAQGIRQFVVGTGGKNLRAFETTAANSEVRNNDTYGVLKLTLHPSSYDWEFVPEAGKTFTDSGSAPCH